MPLTDIVFGEGDIQNFLVETGIGLLNSPKDIVTETNSNSGIMCLETTSLQVIQDIPNVIVLSDGQLAKRITNKFYLKL